MTIQNLVSFKQAPYFVKDIQLNETTYILADTDVLKTGKQTSDLRIIVPHKIVIIVMGLNVYKQRTHSLIGCLSASTAMLDQTKAYLWRVVGKKN